MVVQYEYLPDLGIDEDGAELFHEDSFSVFTVPKGQNVEDYSSRPCSSKLLPFEFIMRHTDATAADRGSGVEERTASIRHENLTHQNSFLAAKHSDHIGIGDINQIAEYIR